MLLNNRSGGLVEDVSDDQKNIQVHHESYSTYDDHVAVNFVLLAIKVYEIDHVFCDPDTRPENNAHNLEYDRCHVQGSFQARLYNRNKFVESHSD